MIDVSTSVADERSKIATEIVSKAKIEHPTTDEERKGTTRDLVRTKLILFS